MRLDPENLLLTITIYHVLSCFLRQTEVMKSSNVTQAIFIKACRVFIKLFLLVS
jgi:hypothetical protein